MFNLLNADFYKLKRNKAFLIAILFTIGVAIFMLYSGYSDKVKYGTTIEVEQLIINYITFIGVVISVFVSLFIGIEYSDGTIRNKIVMGYSKYKIYLSNLIVVILASLLLECIFIGIVAAIGIPLFGKFTMSLSLFAFFVFDMFMIIIAYTAIYTFIVLLCSNKTISTVICILLSFGMLMLSLTLINILNTNEYITQALIGDNGEVTYETVKNPKYPSEEKKKICKTILDIIPAGQGFEIAGRSDFDEKIFPIYSLGVIVFFTSIGIYLFNRKELK